MKPAVAQAPASTIVTKTTTITSEPKAAMPDFWEYLEGELPKTDPAWDKHILYIYRTDPGPSTALGKYTRSISVPGYRDIPLDDREELEWGIRQIFGGRSFRLILKRGSERITEGKCFNDAPPKAPPAIPEGNVVTPVPGAMTDPTAAVARDAIHAVSNRESDALRVATETLAAAGTMITRMAAPVTPPPTPQDDLMRQMMAAMVQKMMNPPDPLESFARMLALVREANPHPPAAVPGSGGTGNAAVDTTVNKILETGLDRILNPPPAPGSTISVGSELVRALPMIGGYVVQAMQEWRLGMQAQSNLMPPGGPGMRPPGQVPPPPRSALPAGTIPSVPAQPGTPAQPTMPPVAPGAGMTPGGDMTPPLVWIETRLVEFLRQSATAEEAADKFAAFLELSCPELVDKLIAAGKDQVAQLFQLEPVLREGTAGMPPERIREFLDKFFAIVSGEAPASEDKPAAKPN